MKFSNIILFVLFILTVLANSYAKYFTNQKVAQYVTGVRDSGKVWVNPRDKLYDQRDKNLRDLLKSYQSRGEFEALESFITINYKDKLYLASKDLLESFSANSLNIRFDQFNPVEVKNLIPGTKVKFINYEIPKETKLFTPDPVNVELEIDGKKLWMSFVNFEQIFIFPKKMNPLQMIKDNFNQSNRICCKEKIYPFTNIETVVQKRDRVIQHMRDNSSVIKKIIGNYFYDVADDHVKICYVVRLENDDETATLQANLKIALRDYRMGNEN